MTAGGGHVADLQLQRFEATESAAGQLAHDVDEVAFVDGRCKVGSTEGDPVEDVQSSLERQLRVPARGLADFE